MAITTGPCIWPDATSYCCAEEWATYDPALQQQALEFATYVIWSATGRQYGLCETTVRPCGRQRSDGTPAAGWYWDGYGTWIPYIWNGNWYNCWCGGGGPGGCCTCDPQCRVYLPGPVNSITQIRVDGSILPVTGSDGSYNYFVLNEQWLIRSDTTSCWPLCSDQNLAPGDPDAFEVTYLQGREPPSVVVTAVGQYACEYAKGCAGQACRLPSRVTNISRQGVSISMADINDVLKNGLTGLWEVDQVIMHVNPNGLKGRARLYSPDLPEGNQVSWP